MVRRAFAADGALSRVEEASQARQPRLGPEAPCHPAHLPKPESRCVTLEWFHEAESDQAAKETSPTAKPGSPIHRPHLFY
jgi:hypothetical protein